MSNITAKELTAIEDHLGMEQTLIKKYNMYAGQSTDTKLKSTCEQMASRHQQHYDALLGHLN